MPVAPRPTATSWSAPSAQLPIDQRSVFVLHHYVGLPLVEIAETLGIPAGTARSRLHYATRALRSAVEADRARCPSRKDALA